LPGDTPGIARGAPSVALKSFAGVLLRNLAAEEERWLGWCVFAFGSGIAIYFSLKAEPSLALAGGVGLVGLLCSVRAPKDAGTAMRCERFIGLCLSHDTLLSPHGARAV
jgi:hypothetical protein